MDQEYIQELQARGIRIEIIRTFADLKRVHNEFVVGKSGFYSNFLLLIGSPGSGKSTLFRSAKEIYYTNDAVSAVGLYRMAYHNIDKPLAFDDVDDCLINRQALALIRVLGEPGEKMPCWEKMNVALAKEGVPNKFTTTSRICIICNQLPKINMAMKSVLDRAKTIVFWPTAEEIQKFVLTWWPAEHADVAEFIGMNLDKIVVPTIRWYVDAKREKLLGNDWRNWLLKQWYNENPRMAVIAEIFTSGIPKGKAMEEEWHRRTGLGRAIFYRYLSQYRAQHEPPATANP